MRVRLAATYWRAQRPVRARAAAGGVRGGPLPARSCWRSARAACCRRFFVPWAIFYVLCGAFKGADSQVAAYIVDLVAPTHRAAALGINGWWTVDSVTTDA